MPSYFPENNTAQPGDNELRSLQKLVDLVGGGSVGGSTILRGAGDPNGTVTGSATSPLYIDTNTSQTWVWVSGTTWY